jgi:hypothetical protein
MAVKNSLMIRIVDSYAVSPVSSAWLAPHSHGEVVAEADPGRRILHQDGRADGRRAG